MFGATGVTGVFSERDLARAVADGAALDDEPVGQYMTVAAVTVENDAAIGAAIAKMNEHGMRHVVVVTGRDVTGMISMRDVVALLGTAWPEL